MSFKKSKNNNGTVSNNPFLLKKKNIYINYIYLKSIIPTNYPEPHAERQIGKRHFCAIPYLLDLKLDQFIKFV